MDCLCRLVLVPKLYLGTKFGAQAQLGRIFIVPKRSLGTRGVRDCLLEWPRFTALNEQAPRAGTGFVFTVYPDGALARYRAFMLAHAAADTPGGVHERPRQAHHDIHPGPGCRQAVGGQGALQGQTNSGQAGDAPERRLGLSGAGRR